MGDRVLVKQKQAIEKAIINEQVTTGISGLE